MNFRYYDLMSSLISGVLVAVSINIIFDLGFDYDAVPLMAVAYVIGYFVNAVSAILENLYFWTMGGKPSDVLLTPVNYRPYTGYERIKFYETDHVINLLKIELNDDNPSLGKMFGRAMAYSNDDEDTRVPDFNAQYAFSRVILTTSLILSVLWLSNYYVVWWMWILAIFAVYMSWRRCKERGFYYAREVLTVYIKKNQ
jgi:hypothetical protein